MSLLLQALQKASKNREDGAEPGPGPDPLDSEELSLEPLGAAAQGEAPREASVAAAPSATPAQAAAMMQVSRAPAFDPIEYAREHYMLMFIAIAFLFAAGYGGYVYVQVSNPSWLRRSAPPPPPPLASAPAPAPAASEPASAKISGIPSSMQTPPAQAAAPVQTPPAAQAVAQAQPAAPEQHASPAQPAPQAAAPAEAPKPAPAVSAPAEARPLVKQPVIAAVPSAAPRAAASKPRRAAEDTVVRQVDEDGIETVVLKPAAPARNASAAEKPVVAESPSDLMRAYEALQAGDSAQARTLYEQVLKSDPRNIDALLGLGAIAWKDGRIDEAMQHYQRVLELEPRNTYAQAGLIAMVGSADPAASETRLRQLIARDPSGFLYFTLGNLYADQGLWPAAQQAYFQAYQSQPENPDYAFNLAVGLEHIGQARPALEYYRKALDLSFRKGRANFDQSLVIQRVGQLSSRVEQ
ncbi:MAG TPA: tetratricopeptide repeat protein [Burkholderiales bacterium]|nr:tetratricopeptide repeat protein [Burkholderiales bacterium]